jgi:allantoate deiminase
VSIATPASRYASTVLERCDALATFSDDTGRLTRRFATPAWRAAGEAIEGWMREAGMATRRDAIGNVIGRMEGAGSGTFVLGSHLDTVVDAGRYDGPLGVLVAIACAQRVRDEDREPPFAIEVVAFADEEGVRYGTAYLGSATLAGTLDQALLERTDANGISMAEAIAAIGGDPGGVAAARRDPADLLGYCEVHIEQGPVLENEDVPVGVVTAIAGQTRARVTFAGSPGHAGTVPMAMRHDALPAAAEWILAVEETARASDGLVATVGDARIDPGAANVIPGQVIVALDVRHADDDARAAAAAQLRQRADAIARARDLRSAWAPMQDNPAVECSPALAHALSDAVSAAGHRVVRLPSGAGHDAVAMSAIAPVAMLFVRCEGGISHHPAESVAAEDVAVAIDVLSGFLGTTVSSDAGSRGSPADDGHGLSPDQRRAP